MPDEVTWAGFLNPPLIFAKLGLNKECRDVVEFGCGYGTFTVEAARIISGTIHAFDIESAMIEAARLKITATGLINVRLYLRDFVTDGTGLPSQSVQYAMLFNILHAERPLPLLEEAWRVLSSEGRLAIIHWNYDPSTPRGPSMTIRPRPQQCQTWAHEAGFHLVVPGIIDLPPYHYGMVLQKMVR